VRRISTKEKSREEGMSRCCGEREREREIDRLSRWEEKKMGSGHSQRTDTQQKQSSFQSTYISHGTNTNVTMSARFHEP